jgi:hypothetical protein
MTGFYVRICRDGKWQAIDVAEMTDDELEKFFDAQGLTPERLAAWARSLAKWIRDNVKVVGP